MPYLTTVPGVALTEMLLSGDPVTPLESLLYFGYADIANRAKWMRKQSFDVKTRPVATETVLARIEAALGSRPPMHVCSRYFAPTMMEYFYVPRYTAAEASAKGQVAALLAKMVDNGEIPEGSRELVDALIDRLGAQAKAEAKQPAAA